MKTLLKIIKDDVDTIEYEENGGIYYCNEFEWKRYQLEQKIISLGVEEKTVKELVDAVREECEYDKRFY